MGRDVLSPMKYPSTVFLHRFLLLLSVLGYLSSARLASAQTTLYVPSGTSGIGSSSNTNVGIGTPGPSSQLHLFGAAGASAPAVGAGALYLQDSGGAVNNGGSLLFGAFQGYWAGIKGLINNGSTNTTGDLAFYTRNAASDTTLTERMRIRQSGNVEVGGSLQALTLVGRGSGQIQVQLINDGDTIDQRISELIQWNGQLTGRFVNSAYTAADNWLLVTRNTGSYSVKNVVFPSGNVGIGTTDPGSYKLGVNGNIHARGVVVNQTGWSDYVFEECYQLSALSDVAQFIKEKKHLPGIPSAAEIAQDGVNLGDMQARLLAKVEELTLHLIRLDKENVALRHEVELLKKGR